MALTKVSRGLLSTSIVDNGNATAITIDSSENVGIGTSSPETNLHIEDSSSFSIIRLVASTTENAGIDFGDPDDRDIGRVRYNNSDNSMVFHTNAAERMRIDSSGAVGIGVNDPDAVLDISSGTNELGIFRVTQRLSGASAYGLDVGLDPTLGDPVFSRIVNDTVTESFRINRSNGALISSGGITLGTSSGAYNAANTLDDYEEGTWTPAALLYSGTMTVNSATYEKIGRQVTLRAEVSFDNTTDASSLLLTIPFNHGSGIAGSLGIARGAGLINVMHKNASARINGKKSDDSSVSYSSLRNATIQFTYIYATA